MRSFGVEGPGPAGFLFTAITAVILVAAWVILASSRFIQGGIVERPERVPQLYGYTVCLVTLIWALSTGMAIVENVQALELRKRYETYRADRIATTEVTARQSLVKNAVSLLLAVGLFMFHWRWLRRPPTTAPAT